MVAGEYVLSVLQPPGKSLNKSCTVSTYNDWRKARPVDPTRYDPRPLYEQVADRLRQAISDGDLKPGDQLPAEDELAERHQVSRQTIRRALQDLTSEGLVSSGRGRGRVVRAYQPLRWHLSEYESRHRHEKIGDQTADQWN